MAEDVKVGRCLDMCPPQERMVRQEQRRLHPLEIVPGSQQRLRPATDAASAVKEYTRSAAGKLESTEEELRPPDVLMKTIQYLLQKIVTREDVPYRDIYDFVFDRLRSVRQDMVIQQLAPRYTVAILQPIIRFHLYSGYRLCEEPIMNFDPHINKTHTQECLKKLLVCYEEYEHSFDSQVEFEVLYLLYNLGSMEALSHVLSLPEHIRIHEDMKFALDLSKAFLENNFVRLFTLLPNSTALQACAVQQNLLHIKSKALQVVSTGFSSKNTRFPVSILTKWLDFTEELHTIEFCQHHGLIVENNFVHLMKTAFKIPQSYNSTMMKKSCHFIDGKVKNGVNLFQGNDMREFYSSNATKQSGGVSVREDVDHGGNISDSDICRGRLTEECMSEMFASKCQLGLDVGSCGRLRGKFRRNYERLPEHTNQQSLNGERNMGHSVCSQRRGYWHGRRDDRNEVDKYGNDIDKKQQNSGSDYLIDQEIRIGTKSRIEDDKDNNQNKVESDDIPGNVYKGNLRGRGRWRGRSRGRGSNPNDYKQF
ncbi:SAC3 domain-containing protein 1-like [Saccoglossus kowalevskii]|uniref:Germinal-center associated nuclear protein-like n=1 Tax=Saccoglossus kowalevskii TaxID=10224 RepID=A0ABM0MFX5_SACKO|nr:PREDICTED: germinal-center associated nuclear protein-like [Saccoglossus kowalevskii]